MKLRVIKSQLEKALLYYTNHLYERHHGTLLTPARVELIKRDLYAWQQQLQRTESNSVWKVPVDVLFDFSTNTFSVIVADDSNVLFLHEE